MAEIAVVGMGCWYPGARDVRQLWENVLSRRQQFRQMPDVRLPLSDYHAADPTTPDKTYGTRAAVIDGFTFDWGARRIPKSTFEATDIVHWLALEVAQAAIADAGYTPKNIPSERSAVILGNTLTGEFTRSNVMRLRWPYVRKALRAAAQAKGLDAKSLEMLEQTMEVYYKSVFAPITEDTLAGALSNTIAGRIANVLNFDGGNYTVDGACSSSLIAVSTAAQGLDAGDLDLAVAGGVDVSLDTFELIGFAKVGALTKGDMSVYDRKGQGFIPGEGCGFVVLKRLEDARRDGNQVYAVIRGWGISSDGRGGVTAPNAVGQSKALLRAYKRAGYPASSVDFIEGHGTGTRVGDKTELEGVVAAVTAEGPVAPRQVGMTSFKSIVGHTKAAAGVGGFIKAVCAVNRRVVPPTAGCREPHPIFDDVARSLYPVLHGRVRGADRSLRAGVSAMGFGGINCHVTLESGDAPAGRLAPTVDERALVSAVAATEVFVLDATSLAGLRTRIADTITKASGIALCECVDLSSLLTQQLAGGKVRLAVIANSPDDLIARLREVDRLLAEGAVADGDAYVSPKQDIWLSQAPTKSRMGFVFPGQGSQRVDMARALVERFPSVRALLQRFDEGVPEALRLAPHFSHESDRAADDVARATYEHALSQTEIAQPAIVFTSLAWLQFLHRLGLTPNVVAGHSLGELTAAYAAGVLSERQLIDLVRLRGAAMSAPATHAGAMASLACGRDEAHALIARQDGYVVVANVNSPSQTVVSGDKDAVAAVVDFAKSSNIAARMLPVSNAFHSARVGGAAEHLRSHAKLPNEAPRLRATLLTGMGGGVLPTGDLREHFARQILAEVDFVAVARGMADLSDVVVEVGPGRVLSGLLKDTLGDRLRALSVESRPFHDADLNTIIAAAFAGGHDLQWSELFVGRLVRGFVPASERVFITNPCELPFPADIALPEGRITNAARATEPRAMNGDEMADMLMAMAASLRGQPHVATPTPIALAAVSTRTAVSEPAVQHASPASKPGPVPAATANAAEIAAALVERVAQRTGFAPSGISLDMRLVDDLNMDSIKASEVIGAVARQFGVASLDPAGLENATLDELTQAILKARGAEPATPAAAIAPIARRTALSVLFALVSQKTGFAQASLDAELTLLDDLNLDSIKAAELIAAAAKEMGVRDAFDPSQFANATLGQLALVIDDLVAKQPQLQQTDDTALSVVLDEFARLTQFARGQFSLATKPVEIADFTTEKLERLVVAVADRLGVPPAVDIAAMLDCSLSRIAKIFDAIAAQQRGDEVRDLGPSWVRSFTVDLVPQRRQLRSDAWASRRTDRWSEANALVLAQRSQLHDMAEPIRDAIQRRGGAARICLVEEDNCAAAIVDASYSIVVSLLPTRGTTLATMVERLRQLSQVPAAAQGPRRWTTVAVLQQIDGRFGRLGSNDVGDFSALSFLASLHHERPDLRVRMVDVAPGVSGGTLADAFLDELMTSVAFEAVGIDAQMTRVVPRMSPIHPSALTTRAAALGADDVVLVTGGAKGITAECALALAQHSRAKMVLVGSSAATGAGAEEIARTLERFRSSGLSVRYHSCNIADAAAVRAMVALVEQEHGPITAVIHGAGVNKPRRAAQVDAAAALQEITPKLVGMQVLLAQFAERPLKLFAAMTSVIGVTGMPGNAWYAFSNEAVDILLRGYQKRHENAHVVSLAYSVWDEVGMGAKMGSVKGLKKLGIDAIPRDAGVERFMSHMLYRHSDVQAVITARLGGLDTWVPTESAKIKTGRYRDSRVVVMPGVEVITRSHLTLQDDPYLVDHLYNGSYLFPTVFGLEAMAQTVALAVGREQFAGVVLEDVRLERPIVVDPNGGATIEVRAQVRPGATLAEDRVDVAIYSESSGFARAHFSATFCFPADAKDATPAVQRAQQLMTSARAPLCPAKPADLDPKLDLYGGLLFQGPRFQRLQAVHALDDQHCVFADERAAAAGYLLGDPYYRDVLLQAGQLVIPQHLCLPVAVKRWRPDVDATPGRVDAVTYLDERDGKTFHATVHVLNADGAVSECLEGYALRILEERPSNPTASQLARPTTQRVRRKLTITAALQGEEASGE